MKSDVWDKAMESLPKMSCGRLDMETWNAVTGEPQKCVYFEGEEERVLCEGKRADFVAYAANQFQSMKQEIEHLRAQLRRSEAYAQERIALVEENRRLRSLLGE